LKAIPVPDLENSPENNTGSLIFDWEFTFRIIFSQRKMARIKDTSTIYLRYEKDAFTYSCLPERIDYHSPENESQT